MVPDYKLRDKQKYFKAIVSHEEGHNTIRNQIGCGLTVPETFIEMEIIDDHFVMTNIHMHDNIVLNFTVMSPEMIPLRYEEDAFRLGIKPNDMKQITATFEFE